jgi:REP element-mobilizing transposase RayT
MKSIIRKIGYDYDFDIQELKIPEVHIHMIVKSEPKLAPSHVMQVIKSISAREFLSYIQRLRNDTSGVVSFGHRAGSSKPSAMPMKRQSRNMFKTNSSSWMVKKRTPSSWVCSKTRSLAADFFKLVSVYDLLARSYP